MGDNFMPSPYAPKVARQVGAVGPYLYIVGPERSGRYSRFFAEERLKDGRTVVRRRFKEERLALDQVARWQNLRRLQEENPL